MGRWIKTQNNPGKEIRPGGFAMNIGRLRMRSIRLGIRHRLYLAVGAIASCALISAAAGWFALTRLDHAIVTVTDEGVTAMTAALNLSKQVSDLAGVAPDIVTAQRDRKSVV